VIGEDYRGGANVLNNPYGFKHPHMVKGWCGREVLKQPISLTNLTKILNNLYGLSPRLKLPMTIAF
jgi:hypothetical protein